MFNYLKTFSTKKSILFHFLTKSFSNLKHNQIEKTNCIAKINLFTQRTHNCGELCLSNQGQIVELFGWLAYQRLNKFFVLRDSYGTVQATVRDSDYEKFSTLVKSLNYECVLRVKGKVVDRGRNRNKLMATGDIEVEIDEMEVLNNAIKVLPLSSDNLNNSLEHKRLQYRYLDLRSKKMQHNLRLRSKIQHLMRRYLIENCGFVDIETPTLSQWTPGGAAEFVVPAAKPNIGHFYTLPQSPQIYKQLLMCGGIDRYFQIARCYRNEGTKSDRQPEFTQIDLELSFTTQNQIIHLVESLIINSWPLELEQYKPNTPFPRISYKEAIKLYKTDKPDLRNHSKKMFEFMWVVNFPLFTKKTNENNNQVYYESTHHPFTNSISDHLDDLKNMKNLENIEAQHYDLILNGVELGGGSIRIHEAKLQEHVLKNVLGLPTKTLSGFLEALSLGAPPHGGFALGLDRYVAILAKESLKINGIKNNNALTIRDVIAFPKTKNGNCLMMGAPTVLPLNAYKDYKIKIDLIE